MWDLSSPAGDKNHIPCIARWILNCSTTSEVTWRQFKLTWLLLFSRQILHSHDGLDHSLHCFDHNGDEYPLLRGEARPVPPWAGWSSWNTCPGSCLSTTWVRACQAPTKTGSRAVLRRYMTNFQSLIWKQPEIKTLPEEGSEQTLKDAWGTRVRTWRMGTATAHGTECWRRILNTSPSASKTTRPPVQGEWIGKKVAKVIQTDFSCGFFFHYGVCDDYFDHSKSRLVSVVYVGINQYRPCDLL